MPREIRPTFPMVSRLAAPAVAVVLTAVVFGAAVLAAVLATAVLAARPGPPADRARPPHPVGFRWVEHHDHTRSGGARLDFEGRPTGAPTATVLRIGIWYPAHPDASGRRMRYGDYRELRAPRDLLTPTDASGEEAMVEAVRNTVRFGLGREIPAARARAILADTLGAIRDARPAAGRFPVVLGGLGPHYTAALLAEHLARQGYVVVSAPPSPGATSLQVTNRPAALEVHTRNLEVARAVARHLEMADTLQLTVAGINFDGLAAIAYQLRNMDAAAVVTLDGWEGKPIGSGTLIESPWFDARKLRVPYLAFLQDAPPSENLRPDGVVLDSLRYAHRGGFVLEGMDHVQYIDAAVGLAVEPDLRPAHELVLGSVETFLDAALAGPDSAALDALRHIRERGGTEGMIRSADVRAALAPIPTPAEFERLVMSGEVGRVRAIAERAWREDSAAVLFTPRDMRLFAFRFAQQERWDETVAILELAVEAYPGSVELLEALGDGYRGADRVGEALGAYERALRVLEDTADGEATVDRAERIARIGGKIEALSR